MGTQSKKMGLSASLLINSYNVLLLWNKGEGNPHGYTLPTEYLKSLSLLIALLTDFPWGMMLKAKGEALGQRGNTGHCHQPTWKKNDICVSVKDSWDLTDLFVGISCLS